MASQPGFMDAEAVCVALDGAVARGELSSHTRRLYLGVMARVHHAMRDAGRDMPSLREVLRRPAESFCVLESVLRPPSASPSPSAMSLSTAVGVLLVLTRRCGVPAGSRQLRMWGQLHAEVRAGERRLLGRPQSRRVGIVRDSRGRWWEEGLGIACPGCGARIPAHRLFHEGLECGCGATPEKLATATRSLQSVVYMFAGREGVRYVGVTTDLPRRLGEHKRGRLQGHHTLGKGLAVTAGSAKKSVHVSLYACESALIDLLSPSENLNRPSHPCSFAYRMVDPGTGATVEYDVRRCVSVHAAALCLEARGRHGAALLRALLKSLPRARTRARTRSRATEVLMRGVGLLQLQRRGARFDMAMRPQTVVVPKLMARPVGDYRVGRCERQRCYGYCRCRVPCTLRWTMVGEPEDRAANRDLYTRWEVLRSDSQAVARLVQDIQRCGRSAVLTSTIMNMRAALFYGPAVRHKASRMTPRTRHVYLDHCHPGACNQF